MRVVSKHEVPQWVFELSEQCAELADSIAVKYGTCSHLPPLVGMNMAHAAFVQCFELLDYYYDRWDRIESSVIEQHGPTRIRSENEQRVSLIQKSTFILSMSSFEAAAKETLKIPGCPISVNGKRVYLGGIMTVSHAAGLIDENDAKMWTYAVELRNCIVHNNAIAHKTMRLELEGGIGLKMVAGTMTQSTPRKSALLLKAILLAYSRWCDNLLSALNPYGPTA